MPVGEKTVVEHFLATEIRDADQYFGSAPFPGGQWIDGTLYRKPKFVSPAEAFWKRLQPRVRAKQVWYQHCGGTGVRGVQLLKNVESRWSPASIGMALASKWRPYQRPASL